MTFALNGREYKDIYITDYRVKLETLDGDGTGRSKAYGWPLIRDPQGQIINLVLEFFGSSSGNNDFRHLWNVCKSMGKTDYALVKFRDPLGSVIEQRMYLVASELKYKRIEFNGQVFTDRLQVSFIAEKGS